MVDEVLVAAGLRDIDHPVLRGALDVAAGSGLLLAGRLAANSVPWRAAVVDIVLTAGIHSGCPVVDQLVLDDPPPEVDRAVQVHLGPLDGRTRSVRVFCRRAGTEEAWTCHAEGTVTADIPTDILTAAPTDWARPWPPAGATPQGEWWHRGDELFAEVSVADDVTGYALHPALLDAALRDLPAVNSLRGVREYATNATTSRIRIAPTEGGHTVAAVDSTGRPVFEVDTVARRTGALVTQVAGLGPEAGRRLVLQAVAGHVAAVLPEKCADGVPMDKPLHDVGFDSMNSVELSNLLSADTGLPLLATVVFDHPTLTALADHLHAAIAPRPRSTEGEVRAALEHLETLLREPDAARDAVTALVRETLTRLGVRTAADATAGIDSASDEEIFALIDNR